MNRGSEALVRYEEVPKNKISNYCYLVYSRDGKSRGVTFSSKFYLSFRSTMRRLQIWRPLLRRCGCQTRN